MKVIYIAGKYRGPNAWAIEQNIRAAEEVAARVWAMGMVALCPHANARHMEGVTTDEHMLAGTLELLRRCDAVVMVPNWRDSAGARAEVDESDRLGIEVIGRSYAVLYDEPEAKAAVTQHIIALTMQDLKLWRERKEQAS